MCTHTHTHTHTHTDTHTNTHTRVHTRTHTHTHKHTHTRVHTRTHTHTHTHTHIQLAVSANSPQRAMQTQRKRNFSCPSQKESWHFAVENKRAIFQQQSCTCRGSTPVIQSYLHFSKQPSTCSANATQTQLFIPLPKFLGKKVGKQNDHFGQLSAQLVFLCSGC